MPKFTLQDLENAFIRGEEIPRVSYDEVGLPGRIESPPLPDVISLEELRAMREGLPTLDLQGVNPLFAFVPLPSGIRDTINTTGDLISGETGNFRDLLEGEPEMESLQRLHAIENRNFQNQFIPNLENALSSGPGGAGFDSGRTAEITRDAYLGLADSQAQERFEFDQLAKDRSLQASAQLPALASIQDIERQHRIANSERMINTHFLNQELEYREFVGELAVLEQALKEAGFLAQQEQFLTQSEQFNANFQLSQNQLESQIELANAANELAAEQFNSNLELQIQQLEYNQLSEALGIERQLDAIEREKKGGLFSSIGTIVGGIAGAFIGGPAGAAVGASLGGSLGGVAGGGSSGGSTAASLSNAAVALALTQSGGGGTASAGFTDAVSPELANQIMGTPPVQRSALSQQALGGIVASNSAGLSLGGGPAVTPAQQQPIQLAPSTAGGRPIFQI